MKNSRNKDLLVIGIGNDGRQDDGLGWRFLDILERKYPGIRTEYRYQLQVEDAELISNYRTVVFIDASKEEYTNGFRCTRLAGVLNSQFSTHAIQPEIVLGMCEELYHEYPETYLLAISGYTWELQCGLSEKAKSNLLKAEQYFREFLNSNKYSGLQRTR